MKRFLLILLFSNFSVLLAQDFSYDKKTKASDFAKEFFGTNRSQSRVKSLKMGEFRAGISTTMDCGNIDVNADLKGEFEELKKQVDDLIPKNSADVLRTVKTAAMIGICYAWPTVCAQIRHDFLSIKANLNLRSQACAAVDKYVDSQAEVGSKQLKAEAQSNCVSQKLSEPQSEDDINKNGKMTQSRATRECQKATGLPIRDFQAGMEKKFSTGKQKVLSAILNFSKESDDKMYPFVASLLGEIEVQEDGFWQPLFEDGMLRPSDVVADAVSLSQDKMCSDLKSFRDVRNGVKSSDGYLESLVAQTAKLRLTEDDINNLKDLNDEDKELACFALARSVASVALQKAGTKVQTAMSSGLLNSAIPTGLRLEYRTRSQDALQALKDSLATEETLTLNEVRKHIGRLARATREKNRLMASSLSQGKQENERQTQQENSSCTDTLSCGGN